MIDLGHRAVLAAGNIGSQIIAEAKPDVGQEILRRPDGVLGFHRQQSGAKPEKDTSLPPPSYE